MVLIDFSHLTFRMLYVAIQEARPKKKNGKYVTNDFKDIFIFLIIQSLINIKKRHREYGEIIICIDSASKGYWRKDICSMYKSNRAKARDNSDINFEEVFEVINDLLTNLKLNFPFKIIEIEKTEADDIIIVLSKMISESNTGKCLIYSEDKDFFQMLKYPRIDFFRPVAKQWVTLEDKDMNKWLLEHVCLGDKADNVPKIIDNIYFSDNFKMHLMNFGITEIDDQMQLDLKFIDNTEPNELQELQELQKLKENIFSTFTINKKNRKNEDTGELDIYKDKSFGVSTLEKAIKNANGLDNFLDSHPYIRKRYEINKILVLEEHIPEYLKDLILKEFFQPAKEYNLLEIEEFFKKYQLFKLMPEINILLDGFKQKSLNSAADFGWE